MKKSIIIGVALIVLIACSKDKYQDAPQISLKSISSSVVPIGSGLNITLSYTDKQGDISDTLFIKKNRLNQTVVPTVRDTILYKIPDFPDYDKGEIGLALTYEIDLKSAIQPPPIVGTNPTQYQPDTLNIQIWIHDKAKHVSDTVSTGRIIVMRTN